MTILVPCFIVTNMTTHGNGWDERGPLVDRERMGRLLRAARIVAGYDRVEDAAHAMTESTGLTISSRTLYALERGEQSVSLDHLIAAAMTFRPPTGIAFFREAVRDDVKSMLEQSEREANRGRP